MTTVSDLIHTLLGYLQSAGGSLRELARQANIPPERLADARPELSPSQVARLWALAQERMRSSSGFSQQVRQLIGNKLESGRARAALIAAELNISRQTLYKRLKQENQTFAALLDEVRREQALAYVNDPSHSLTEVAQRLGFSELSAFSRAFKRWMGQSPARYRAGNPGFS
jgi:AraC-like DNA-binding protein